jgi:hypothetical protein
MLLTVREIAIAVALDYNPIPLFATILTGCCLMAIVFTVAGITNFSQDLSFEQDQWVSSNFSIVRTGEAGLF